jgi:hypothetical protein
MMKPILLDAQQAIFRQREAFSKREHADYGFIHRMRQEARILSQRCGTVTCDDLRMIAVGLGLAPSHPNSWGAIFRGPQWILVGRQRSRVVSNHAREIRVWKYNENPKAD